MRGRKPVPYKLKILTQSAPGFDRGGHKIVAPPPFARGGVQKPADLSPDANEFWDKVVPELERLELVGETNFAGLVAMAECYARMMEATRIIRQKEKTNGTRRIPLPHRCQRRFVEHQEPHGSPFG